MKPRVFEGGCLCGAIRFRATGVFDKPHRKDLAPTAHSHVSRRPRWWHVAAEAGSRRED